MKISVIITAYNRRDYILNAIRSVVDQTFSKDMYEVIIVKSFEDKNVDDYISKLGYKNIVFDTPRYGERIVAGIEESSGDVLAFLEDDDEFKHEKLSKVYKAFALRKDISYFHDTREFMYYDRIVDINTNDPLIKPAIKFFEEITPHNDIIIDAFNRSISDYLVKFYGVAASVSLMSIRKECIENKLYLLKNINISLEDFIPAFAGECGKLYHTKERLTRYRIHSKNATIAFSHEDQIKKLEYIIRCIRDCKLILSNNIVR